MRRYVKPTVYGDESSLRSYERTNFGAPVLWESGTIQVFDTDAQTALPGFTTPAQASVSADGKQLLWRPAYGTGAGELRAIDRSATYYVRWIGVDTADITHVAELIEWTVKVR